LPQKRAMNVPVTKKGPKGISLLRVFFFKTISPIPIIAPRKKAKKRAMRIFGKPRKSPIKKANLGSPQPIHLPRETKTIAKKKAEARIAENNELKKSLTEKWKISLSSGYDFTQKEMTLTSVNVYRDLHCWEMRFNWVPFGFRQSFSIDINVKSSVLRDLKLSRRRGWQDYQ